MVSYLDFGPFSNIPWKENPCYLIIIWPVNISDCWDSLLEGEKRGLTIIIAPTITISHYRWIKEIYIILLFESIIDYTLWMNEVSGNFKMMHYGVLFIMPNYQLSDYLLGCHIRYRNLHLFCRLHIFLSHRSYHTQTPNLLQPSIRMNNTIMLYERLKYPYKVEHLRKSGN